MLLSLPCIIPASHFDGHFSVGFTMIFDLNLCNFGGKSGCDKTVHSHLLLEFLYAVTTLKVVYSLLIENPGLWSHCQRRCVGNYIF